MFAQSILLKATAYVSVFVSQSSPKVEYGLMVAAFSRGSLHHRICVNIVPSALFHGGYTPAEPLFAEEF